MRVTEHTPRGRLIRLAILLAVAACSRPATPATPRYSSTLPPPTATLSKPTLRPQLLPLSEPGPYVVGKRTIAFTDAARDNRPVSITLWYPAISPTPPTTSFALDAAPDASGAPYPLILSSTKLAYFFAGYLVSHGFVWASVDNIDTYPAMNEEMFEQPLDILFALNQAASAPPADMVGMIDAEHAGVIGYSFDGYNALALSGARIDPAYYLAQCPNPDPTTEPLAAAEMSAFDCAPARSWDDFSAHAGKALASSGNGLWRAMTDERIRAVMPLAGEGWWLFGARGLAAVDRPVLMITGTEDSLYKENALVFEHLGTSDKQFISFMGQQHLMVLDRVMVARMAHFAVAFFGYHLQGRQDLSWYFSKDFVEQQDGLAWGVLPSK